MQMTQRSEDIDPSVIERVWKVYERAGNYQPGKNAAYRSWLSQLNPQDKLPRGTFFKDKRATSPLMLDEAWLPFTR